MKNLIPAIFALTGIAWAGVALTPASIPSGKVEAQIRSIAPQISPQLATSANFDRVQQSISGTAVTGYRPRPELPQSPAGLKPAEQQAWLAMAQREAVDPRAEIFSPFFPTHYSQGTQVHAQGMTITLRPVGSTSASAMIENGKLVYHEAYPETDSLQVVRDGGSEEFLLLHSSRAPPRFEYELTGVTGVREVTLKDNAIHFRDAKGRELQLEAPWLEETGGIKTANQVHWELTPYAGNKTWPRLALVVSNASKLHYPVLIDPSWTAVGNMATLRSNATATLLTNGQVLVSGGIQGGSYLTEAELYNPATGIWTVTGSLQTGRSDHTATLLRNGLVLVAGGFIGSRDEITSAAELYNPATGTWTATGSLNTGRARHTATLLANGQVLVAAGFTNGPEFSAELYDPATGTWTATGNLSSEHVYNTATLLPNGYVLVVGGLEGSFLTAVAELYNPAAGTWTTTGSLAGARCRQTATLLPNGQVLVAGGSENSASPTAELYNPATGAWTTTGSVANPRYDHTATLLPNGQVLIAGGYSNQNSGYLSSAELYNPAMRTWTTVASLSTARSECTSTLLPSGQVLVAGGANTTGVLASSELYDYTSGTWGATGSMTNKRYGHTATLLTNGQILVVGGYNYYSGSLSSTELYNPDTGTWSTTGSMANARDAHTATLLPNGKILVAGGENNSSAFSGAELYDPTTGTWSITGNMANARYSHTATLLSNGQVLVAGGTSDPEPGTGLAGTELYNPATGTWSVTGSLATGRAGHTATLMPNGNVLVAGGYTGVALSSAELYNPATEIWSATGSLSTARYIHTATLLANGEVLVAGGYNTNSGILSSAELYNPATGAWTTTGSLNSTRESHTATLLLNGKVLVAGGGGMNTGILSSTELYDPARGIWSTTGSLNTSRLDHMATLLPNGEVLVEGGLSGEIIQSSAELFNPGLGYTSATQPQVNTVTTLDPETFVDLTGTGFTGTAADLTNAGSFGPSEASGGATNNSASNLPVVVLQSLGNDQTLALTLDSSSGFSSTAYAANPVDGSTFPFGYARLTMFVNGTPSTSQIVLYQPLLQTITFASIPDQIYGATVTLGATASSGGPVSYTTTGVASVSGTTLTFTGAGAGSVTAHQAGTTDYAAATSVTQNFTVDKASQTIAQVTQPNLTYTTTPFTLPSLTSSAGLPVTITVQSGPAMISGNQGMLTGTGTVVLAADQAGNADYNAAPEITTSFTVTKASQTITFATIGNQTYGNTVTLAATASSGDAVTYRTTGPATISGNTLTFTGVGNVAIGAFQNGDANYNAAPESRQNFTVSKGSQTIAPVTQPNLAYTPTPFTLPALTSSAGLPVTITVQSGPATISGNQGTLTGVGTVVLAADQAGNAGYNAAPEITTSFSVTKASQTITFPAIGNQVYPSSPITLTGTASSGGAITYDTTGPIKVSGNTLTITGPGTAAIGAHQAGNANYNAAPEVRQSFMITQ